MKVRVIAVDPGAPITVSAVVAGVRVHAEWVGAEPVAGELVDVELETDEVLVRGESIAIDDGRMTLREGTLLRGAVELQEQGLLTVRLAEGLAQLEVDDRAVDVPQGTAIAVVVERLKLYPTGI